MPGLLVERELLESKDHELFLLSDLARQHESDRDIKERYERQLVEIGRSIGCNHHNDDFGLTRCVTDMALGRDRLAALNARLLALVRAVKDCGYGGIVAKDIDGMNWFDLRDGLLKDVADGS